MRNLQTVAIVIVILVCLFRPIESCLKCLCYLSKSGVAIHCSDDNGQVISALSKEPEKCGVANECIKVFGSIGKQTFFSYRRPGFSRGLKCKVTEYNSQDNFYRGSSSHFCRKK